METTQCYSKCDRSVVDPQSMLTCGSCHKFFHLDCLVSGKPSPLVGDIFFEFTCTDCSETNQEAFVRMKLPWLPILMLALYNLQLSSTGCQGYFRWREHICDFIDKHWNVLFVRGRRKTQTWYGTVAGTLSIGCPIYFMSGMDELKQSGWWKLADNAPPTLDILNASTRFQKKEKKLAGGSEADAALLKPAGLRRRLKQSSIQAAMELKAKRDIVTKHNKLVPKFPTEGDTLLDGEDDEVDDIDPGDDECNSITTDMSQTSLNSHFTYDFLDQSSQLSKSSCRSESWLTEKDLVVGANLPEFLMKDDDEDEIDLDPCRMSPEHPLSPTFTALDCATNRLPPLEDILACMDSSAKDGWTVSSVNDSEIQLPSTSDSKPVDLLTDRRSPKSDREMSANEDDDINQSKCASDDNLNGSSDGLLTSCVDIVRRRKRCQESEDESKPVVAEPKLVLMSLYEEKQLVKKFRMLDDSVKLDPSLRRLRQKLFVREQQREHGVSVFDLDRLMNERSGGGHLFCRDAILDPCVDRKVKESDFPLESYLLSTDNPSDDFRILDRYQAIHLPSQKPQFTLFSNRLVGSDSNDLSYIYSPYTTRSLKPFIRRDYQSRPLKLQLLQEIIAFHHRKDPDWKPAAPAPIDYCYVRPQHIPSVNALCKEFFWPGIDLSECLQYPDFSCVVLYRKFVIGFAFMVPDVKCNESYISFIFTHPEWRHSGIASFMLYHLVQTNMGKELTLHVSASNPALLLYQKFGFKEEEFILDFYDKYFPVESTECRHALFMRLRR